MRVIYEPRGRAGEYAKYALEIYKNCPNRCAYCYVPKCTKITREEFAKKAYLKHTDVLGKLEQDCKDYKDVIGKEPVHMAFFSDPYQPIEFETEYTRNAIVIMKKHGLNVQILTKCADLALRDLELLTKDDNFGCTLTFMDDEERKIWEPNASKVTDRFNALFQAHMRGIKTWASLEPVLDAEQALQIIDHTNSYVDLYKVGHTNHTETFPDDLREKVEKIDWHEFAHAVKDKLDSLGKEYIIKKDLRKYL